MRVALVASYYPPFVGGIETHMQELARALIAAGHSVHVTCLTGTPSRTGSVEQIHGVDVTRVGWRGRGHTLLVPDRLPIAACDVVHFHGFSRPLVLRMLRDKPTSIPWILTPHGGLHGTFTDENVVRRTIKERFDGIAGRMLLRSANAIVALTQNEADDLARRFGIDPARVHVLANGLSPEAMRVADVDQGTSGRYVMLSRLARVKRIPDVVAALRDAADLPGCDIYGPDGDGADEVRAALQGVDPARARLLPPIYGNDKYRALRSALALIVSSSVEANSITALEALAQGTPVVASRGAASGLPPDAIALYETGDVDGLRTLLRSLDAAQLNRLRTHAETARSQQLTTTAYATRIVGLYEAAR